MNALFTGNRFQRAGADYSRGATNGERMARLFFAEQRAKRVEANAAPLIAEALRIAGELGRAEQAEQAGFCRAVVSALNRQPTANQQCEIRGPPATACRESILLPSFESTP